jgi:hypothetical protein
MGVTPALVVGAFIEACVQTGGDSARAGDWALARGWEPVRGEQIEAAAPLLEGLRSTREEPGLVLQAEGSAGALLLAVTASGRCVVWAESQDGPAVRLALLRAMSEGTGRTAGARLTVDRTLEHGGLWRNMTQWQLRRAEGAAELRMGAVTTLGTNPAAQALHLAPAALAVPVPASPATQPPAR